MHIALVRCAPIRAEYSYRDRAPALGYAPADQPGRPGPASLGTAPDAVDAEGTATGSAPRRRSLHRESGLGLGCAGPWPVPARPGFGGN